MPVDVANLKLKHEGRFGSAAEVAARAPGRVNLIGEHTDYNDGFVMPATVDREICLVGSANDSDVLNIYSVDMDSSVSVSLDSLDKQSENDWANYIIGVAVLLQEAGQSLKGADISFCGDVPRGSGLSSSAALEQASATFFEGLCGFTLDPLEKVKLCQRAEVEFVGMNCGIMDQFISGMGDDKHCLAIDCRSLEFEKIPLELGDHEILIANTCSPHKLTDSAYNERRSQCEAGVEQLREILVRDIDALRGVSLAEFLRSEAKLEDPVRSRCRHVIEENNRVTQARQLLRDGNLEQFGKLMNQSHISLRVDYEVTSAELDDLVWIAWSVRGVLGSRMTGAGFGGCTVTLVHKDSTDALIERMTEKYYQPRGLKTEIYRCRPSRGAEVLDSFQDS